MVPHSATVWPLPLDFFTPYWVVHCPHKSHIFYSNGGHFGKSIFMEHSTCTIYVRLTKAFWNVTHFYGIITFLKPKFNFFFWMIFYVCRLYFVGTRVRIWIWIEADQNGPQKRKYFSDFRGFSWGWNALFKVLQLDRNSSSVNFLRNQQSLVLIRKSVFKTKLYSVHSDMLTMVPTALANS